MMAADKTKLEFTRMNSHATPIPAPEGGMDAREWLTGMEQEGGEPRDDGLKWLLATTFSEVVWGRKDGDGWQLSLQDATLPADRLLELRAFGPDAEVFVWRDASGLHARRRHDGADGQEFDTYKEPQLMWGTERDLDRPPLDGFTSLRDGQQGLRHAPPLVLDESHFDGNGHRPARLVLRHYVGRDDDTGLARVVDSRLIEVKAERPKTIKLPVSKEEEANENESPA